MLDARMEGIDLHRALNTEPYREQLIRAAIIGITEAAADGVPLHLLEKGLVAK